MRIRGRIVPAATRAMTDIIFIAVTLAFFTIGALYVRFCESL